MTDDVVPDPRLAPPGATDLVEVRVLRSPLLLWQRASEHTDDLLREFALIRFGAAQDGYAVSSRLSELIGDLQARYAGISAEPERQRLAALDAGELSLDLTYRTPVEAAQACTDLLARLEEADEYCRAGDQLITLAAPPDQVAFRRWYLGEFIRQIDGEPPTPWPGSLD